MDIRLSFGDLALTSTMTNSLLVIVMLTLLLMIFSIIIKKADPTKPTKGLMGVLELIYSVIHKFTHQSIGDEGQKFVPFVMTVISYLAVANLVGLIGLVPPTTDINITVALSIATLTYIMVVGILSKGLRGYLKDTFIGEVPKPMLILFIPISIVGELSKIISLSFRLFGNIVSGVLLLGLLTQLMAWLFGVIPPLGGVVSGAINVSFLPFLNAYFDIFAGLMQTFIFCTLTMMWIKNATERKT